MAAARAGLHRDPNELETLADVDHSAENESSKRPSRSFVSSPARQSACRSSRMADFGQFLRQAEVDVLGIRLERCHGAGKRDRCRLRVSRRRLAVWNTDETVGRVLKKLVRAAFALEACLDVDEADIVFATPKMAEPVWRGRSAPPCDPRVAPCRAGRLGPRRRRFRLIANADFVDEILTPVMDKIDLVADTSELFMRAQQLDATVQIDSAPPPSLVDTESSSPGTRNCSSPVRGRSLALASTSAGPWRRWPRRVA